MKNLLKSSPVQSSKTITQTAMSMVADLMNATCGSQLSSAKKYPVSVMGDFCDKKDSVIINEFIPLLARELESSEKIFDRIVALATFGSLGLEEILPVLLPVIRGTPGQFDDTAERLRAISSHSNASSSPSPKKFIPSGPVWHPMSASAPKFV